LSFSPSTAVKYRRSLLPSTATLDNCYDRKKRLRNFNSIENFSKSSLIMYVAIKQTCL
jgi:hypothetical protein